MNETAATWPQIDAWIAVHAPALVRYATRRGLLAKINQARREAKQPEFRVEVWGNGQTRTTKATSPWPHRDPELKEHCAAGLSWGEIGRRMGISSHSARGRAGSLNIKRLELAKLPPPAKRVRIRAPVLRAVVRVAGPPEMARILAVFPPATTEHVEARNAAVNRYGCDMPLWGDRERPTHRYCGAPVQIVDGVRDSYCPNCAASVRTRNPAGATAFRVNGWGPMV